MDAAEKAVHDHIATYGWHCVKVAEDEEGPGFAYTIGFQRSFGHPEVIVFGQHPEVMHAMLSRIAERIRAGQTHVAGTDSWGILDDYKCWFLQVGTAHFREYVGWARWYYGSEPFELLQCVWPDRSGKFQWEEDAHPALHTRQPLLGTP
jgi:hypothetical protein